MGEPVRLAIAFGYVGHLFHGSQFQPDLVTVQGELEKVIHELTWGEYPSEGTHSLKFSSRTDAGVNVRMNLACLQIPANMWKGLSGVRMVQAMNDHLPEGIWVWKVAEAPTDFNPRLPHTRTYRFRLDGLETWPGVDAEDLQKWLSIFAGTHDFTNYSKPEAIADRTRTVKEIKPWIHDRRIIGFEISGQSFVWNQVRRIAAAIDLLARGKVTFEKVKSALENPETPVDLGLTPSEWLTLWSVEHDDFQFCDAEVPASMLSQRCYDRTWREQQHWCDVARSEMETWLRHQGLALRLANN